jgi:hypothetical protein
LHLVGLRIETAVITDFTILSFDLKLHPSFGFDFLRRHFQITNDSIHGSALDSHSDQSGYFALPDHCSCFAAS